MYRSLWLAMPILLALGCSFNKVWVRQDGKNIRNDENYWESVEGYLTHYKQIALSQGICPSCHTKVRSAWFGDKK